jgi:hypothetical protein
MANLWNDSQLAPKCVKTNARGVHAIEQNLAACDVDEPEERQHE